MIKNGLTRYANVLQNIFVVLLLGGFAIISGCAQIDKVVPTEIEISADEKSCHAKYRSSKTVTGAKVVWEKTEVGCIFRLNAEASDPGKALKAIVSNNEIVVDGINKFMSDSAMISSNVMAPGASGVMDALKDAGPEVVEGGASSKIELDESANTKSDSGLQVRRGFVP